MGLALDLAAAAGRDGDVPVGAVVVSPSGEVVGEGRNLREALGDPTAHAEVVALRAAAQALGEWRLEDCTLVVTLEPCPMCAGALLLSRVSRLVLGAWDPKLGRLRLGVGPRARPPGQPLRRGRRRGAGRQSAPSCCCHSSRGTAAAAPDGQQVDQQGERA